MNDPAQHSATPPPGAATTIRQRSTIAWIFLGKDGLRAGWSTLLYLLLIVMMTLIVSLALRSYVAQPQATAPQTAMRTLAGEAIAAAVTIVAALIMSRVERRPFAQYGLKGSQAIADLTAGLVWGIVMLSVLIGLLVATGSLSIDGVALASLPALTSGSLWLAAFVCVALFEEFFFRGYLQFTLARGMAGLARMRGVDAERAETIGFWIAAVILSIGLFAGSHISNDGETMVGIVGVAVAGMVLVFALWRTGSLWWALGFHASWDWAQSFLYGVADSGLAVKGHLLNSHPIGNQLLSGGSVGPEGSIFIIPVLLGVFAVIHVTLPKRAG